MAKELWNNTINKDTNWAGDESTNNLPVSGEQVQKFIKNSLNSKVGDFYYDTTNNRYLVFADEESRNKYLENPQDNSNLVIGTFDAPFNYSAEINLITDSFNAIIKGSIGNYIRFTFDVKNKNGQSIGEDVICTFTFTRGSVKKTLNQKYRAGTTVSINIDDYIEIGTNIITIGIVGQTTLAATTVGVTYQIIDLNLTDSLDISNVYSIGQDTNIEVPYNISGAGIKTVEWYLDGNKLDYVKEEDEITELETSRIKYIPIEGLTQGVHSIQYRAFVTINGEKFYSNILYRDIMLQDISNTDNIIAVGTEFPSTAPIVANGEQLKLYGVSQYITYSLNLGLFNPSYASSTPLEIYIDDVLISTIAMQNGVPVVYDLSLTSYGQKVLKLKTENSQYIIGVDVEKSDTSIEELTQGLTLALSALGKSNSSYDKDTWSYNDYHAVFTGFKWLPTSGWNDNKLMITEGASVTINYAPLSTNSVLTGKTIEFELSTTNISNNDAIICDLRNNNGTGILITASEASITSAGGSKVSTRYKAEENVRISFVINRNTNVINKTLVLMYINGILSGATSYAVNDDFISNKTITIASVVNEADVILKSIRVYDLALSSNQILNNYILYRDNSEEFLRVYDRNDIYEEGTTDFSTDKLSGQLPIMIITGNIPELEATTDKNLQIDVDVEYINIQDQKRSFTIKNGALRPQGTSSMSYPKKNFRLYTQKKDNTILYDSDGNVVENKLYAFKEGSQPVNCWCFKADYAESSGTHNTGIARLWNEAFKNFQINGEYKGRTNAQKAAISANYKFDVRTCIDGFPILMFYRLTEDSPLVFIGKYNFNNDKSTESVFGFKDIPGFDNSKMQCWEVLNNGHHLALFNDTINWNSEWVNAFEGRYPDGNTNSTDLKAFANWMSTVSQSDFATQKWQHFDVYKIAAYYIYLMRFGAVDQVVKNAMFTTEDGQHWYYINYDNDTINGVRNDGLLIYPPTIDRQTVDESFATTVYAYAGHDSRLWNMLEADDEFMSIVREVDNALYISGLSYNNVIDIFDNKQSNKWCERIYNQDAQYKYIGPFADRGVNNLFMLQGSRQSHRKWWLSERFALLDAKYVSGEYKANSFEVKLAGAPIGLSFNIKAGVNTYYGYGVNNVPIQSGILLDKGQDHTFNTTSVLNVGDPLRIYAAPYLEEIDVSNLAPYMAQISISNVHSNRLGTKLKKLIVGNANEDNNSLSELSGINQATRLQELDIQRLKSLNSLDLSNNVQLRTLNALNSGLTSIVLPTGAPIESLSLPASLQAISLNGLFSLTNDGLNIQNNGANLTTLEILNCPELDTKTIVEDFVTYKVASDNECSLVVNDINWENVNADWLIRLGQFRNLSLKGMVEVTEISETQLVSLQEIFGNNCFQLGSEFYIKAPVGLYFIGPDSVRGLTTTKYELVVSGANGESTIVLYEPVSGVSITNGYLTVGDIVSDKTITLLGKFTDDSGLVTTKRKIIKCIAIKYPTTGSILGPAAISKKGTFEYTAQVQEIDDDAKYSIDWELTGEAINNGSVTLGTSSNSKVSIIVNSIETSDITLKAIGKALSDKRKVFEIKSVISLTNGNIILRKDTKPSIMRICYNKGWASNPNYMTDIEASQVLDVSDYFKNCTDTNFDEFIYFVNADFFNFGYFGGIKEITIPHVTLDSSKFFTNMQFTSFKAPNLVSISNEHYENGTSDYNQKGFISADNCTVFEVPNLETIYIKRNSNVRMPVINLPNIENLNFPKLKTIYFPNQYNTIYNITPNKYKIINFPLLDDGQFELSGTFDNLTTINLGNCKFRSFSGKIASKTLSSINGRISDILNVDLSECINLTTMSGFEQNIVYISGLTLPNSFAFPNELIYEKLEYAYNSKIPISDNVTKLTLDAYVGKNSSSTSFSSLNLSKFCTENLEVLTINSPCIFTGGTNNPDIEPNYSYKLREINLFSPTGEPDRDIWLEGYGNLSSINITGDMKAEIPMRNLPSLKSIDLTSLFANEIYHNEKRSLTKTLVEKIIINSDITVPPSGYAYDLLANNTVVSEFTFGYLSRFHGNAFNGTINLKRIYIYGDSLPTPWYSSHLSNLTNVGTNVPEDEPKIIYTKPGVTIPDFWNGFCEKFGFTISQTLPVDN